MSQSPPDRSIPDTVNARVPKGGSVVVVGGAGELGVTSVVDVLPRGLSGGLTASAEDGKGQEHWEDSSLCARTDATHEASVQWRGQRRQ